MPLNAAGWSTEEDEKLIQLVEPHPFLYYMLDPSRKDIIARETTWKQIAEQISKPVEECKKRWRGLRDGYSRCKRAGSVHKTKVGVFEKLHFLDNLGDPLENVEVEEEEQIEDDGLIGAEQQVITDNQEYYEITVVEGSQETQPMKPVIKVLPEMEEPPKKIRKNPGGRKKAIPVPRNIPPIKILPKPLEYNGPKLIRYVEEPRTQENRSQVIDSLIEKVLKENTNEIDVFFRSMAASVKKLQPNLIPKVKMEVCNVIARYEMQSFDKNLQNY
ncbi:unnamed protein product [Diatraea saccharalis]|uniref:Transcription factor Adf-1 n=1 Tax=Diatraea saccharalis TaxID=40085 RepID=A0A9N9R8M4_9NEOP|nr:unnamed protein product [Diatraea saccharalis]